MRPNRVWRSPVQLTHVETGKRVAAEIRSPITTVDLECWRRTWVPARDTMKQHLTTAGVPRPAWPESMHWEWPTKLQTPTLLLSIGTYCIECDGALQGLMLMHDAWTAELPAQIGKALVYVEYLESAPWNWDLTIQSPRYRGVGSVLLAAAVARSLDVGFHGRLGLHALPQAEAFYERIGMCCVYGRGAKEEHEGLAYFEFTEDGAARFLGR